jgi:pSer/pThr/pTyr-binding forkhead associated (FHA) protein
MYVIEKESTIIGRDKNCEVALLQDTMASNRHAEIKRLPTGYYVIDLGSTNGTLVNGK